MLKFLKKPTKSRHRTGDDDDAASSVASYDEADMSAVARHSAGVSPHESTPVALSPASLSEKTTRSSPQLTALSSVDQPHSTAARVLQLPEHALTTGAGKLSDASFDEDPEDSDDDDDETVISGVKKKKRGVGSKMAKALRNVAGKGSKQPKQPDALALKEGGASSLRDELRRLQAANAELESYLEARTFTLQQLERAREDDAKAHRDEIESLRAQLAMRSTEAHLIDDLKERVESLDLERRRLEQQLARVTLKAQQEVSQHLPPDQHADPHTLMCLTEERHNLQKALGAKEAAEALLTKRIVDLEEHVATLTEAAASAENALRCETAEVARLRDDVATHKAANAKMSLENEELQRTLAAVKLDRHEYQTMYQELRERLIELETKHIENDDTTYRELQTTTTTLQGEIDRLTRELATATKQNTELLSMIDALRSGHQTAEEHRDASDAEKLRLSIRVADLESQLQKAQTGAQKHSDEAAQKLEHSERERKLADEELARLKATCMSQEEMLEALQRERDSQRLDLRRLEEQLEAMRGALTRGDSLLGPEEQLHEKLQAYEADKAALLAEMNVLKTELSRHASQKEELETTLRELRALVKERDETLSQLETQYAEREKKIETLSAETLSAQHESEKSGKRFEDLLNELAETKEKLRQAQASQNTTHVELIQIRAELETARQLAEQRSNAMGVLKAECETLQSHLAGAKQLASKAQLEMETLRRAMETRNVSLEKALEQAQKELSDTRECVTALQKKAEASEQNQEGLLKELDEVTEQLTTYMNAAKKAEHDARNARDELRKQTEQRYQLEATTQDLRNSYQVERTVLEKKKETLENEIKELKEELEALRVDASRAKGRANVLEAERDALSKSLETMKTQLVAATNAAAAVSATQSAVEADLRRQIAEHERAAQTQAEQYASLSQRATQLEFSVRDLTSTLNDTRQAKEHFEQRVAELEMKTSELEAQHRELQRTSASLLQDTLKSTSQYNVELEGLRVDAQTTQQRRKELERRLEEAVNTGSADLAKRRELEAQLQTLRTELEEARKAAVQRSEERVNEPSSVSVGVQGTLLSNSVVACSAFPDTLVVVQGGAPPPASTTTTTTGAAAIASPSLSHATKKTVSVIPVLKSRLIECLFECPTLGQPKLPSTIFGQPLPKQRTTAEKGRPMVARVLTRMSKLWELAEDLRLALVQIDYQLSQQFQDSALASNAWEETLVSLRGAARTLEERNTKLETLCNSYLYAAKEARAAAQLDREKFKSLIATLQKRLQTITERAESAERACGELSTELERVKRHVRPSEPPRHRHKAVAYPLPSRSTIGSPVEAGLQTRGLHSFFPSPVTAAYPAPHVSSLQPGALYDYCSPALISVPASRFAAPPQCDALRIPKGSASTSGPKDALQERAASPSGQRLATNVAPPPAYNGNSSHPPLQLGTTSVPVLGVSQPSSSFSSLTPVHTPTVVAGPSVHHATSALRGETVAPSSRSGLRERSSSRRRELASGTGATRSVSPLRLSPLVPNVAVVPLASTSWRLQ